MNFSYWAIILPLFAKWEGTDLSKAFLKGSLDGQATTTVGVPNLFEGQSPSQSRINVRMISDKERLSELTKSGGESGIRPLREKPPTECPVDTPLTSPGDLASSFS